MASTTNTKETTLRVATCRTPSAAVELATRFAGKPGYMTAVEGCDVVLWCRKGNERALAAAACKLLDTQPPANWAKTYQTRSIALAPIQAEVESYLLWLCRQGFVVLAVHYPALPGRDVYVDFAYPAK